MTTEQTLRDALAELGGMVAALLAAESGGTLLCADMMLALTSAEREARRAISLPQAETREEWQVEFTDGDGYKEERGPFTEEGCQRWLRNHGTAPWRRDIAVSRRTVAVESTGPWTPVAPPAFDPAEPKRAKSIP